MSEAAGISEHTESHHYSELVDTVQSRGEEVILNVEVTHMLMFKCPSSLGFICYLWLCPCLQKREALSVVGGDKVCACGCGGGWSLFTCSWRGFQFPAGCRFTLCTPTALSTLNPNAAESMGSCTRVWGTYGHVLLVHALTQTMTGIKMRLGNQIMTWCLTVAWWMTRTSSVRVSAKQPRILSPELMFLSFFWKVWLPKGVIHCNLSQILLKQEEKGKFDADRFQ